MQITAIIWYSCHISYLTSNPSKSNSDLSDLPLTSAPTLPLLYFFLSLRCYATTIIVSLHFYFLLLFLVPLLSSIIITSDLHSYLQYPPVIIFIVYVSVSCYDPLFPSHI